MVGVHIQAEGPLPDIAARRALLRRLLQLPLQRTDDRQRDDGRNHRADQQRTLPSASISARISAATPKTPANTASPHKSDFFLSAVTSHVTACRSGR